MYSSGQGNAANPFAGRQRRGVLGTWFGYFLDVSLWFVLGWCLRGRHSQPPQKACFG